MTNNRFGYKTFPQPPNVILGPLNISETTRVRKLKLKSQLGMVKYSC